MRGTPEFFLREMAEPWFGSPYALSLLASALGTLRFCWDWLALFFARCGCSLAMFFSDERQV
jgi:hypothetical protein